MNNSNYAGPLSVEWEDSGMDRIHGAKESLNFVKSVDFPPSSVVFDDAMQSE